MAGMIFKIETFFKGTSNEDQLDKIAKVLGTADLIDYIEKYDCELGDEYNGVIGNHKKKPWTNYVNNQNKHLANADALDLLSKMLVYDHAQRITAKQATQHKYFEPIRQ